MSNLNISFNAAFGVLQRSQIWNNLHQHKGKKNEGNFKKKTSAILNNQLRW